MNIGLWSYVERGKQMIRFYQRYLSRYTRPCPREESCSNLALRVGLLVALPRIMACDCGAAKPGGR